MKKLLLLLFLIPVLSWADCPGPSNTSLTIAQSEYLDNLHCEIHRCSEINDQTSSCVCKNLGGVTPSDVQSIKCNDSKYLWKDSKGDFAGISFVLKDLKASHWSEKPIISSPPTPTPASTPKVSIDDAKIQCEDIGFKPKTERFGECVLELNR